MAKATEAKKATVVETKVETPVEKPVEKKAAVKKTTTPRTTAKKIEEVYVQFGKLEWNVAQLTEKAKAAYVAEGNKASSIKKLCLYVKPEDGKAYYVVNDVDTGSVAL